MIARLGNSLQAELPGNGKPGDSEVGRVFNLLRSSLIDNLKVTLAPECGATHGDSGLSKSVRPPVETIGWTFRVKLTVKYSIPLDDGGFNSQASITFAQSETLAAYNSATGGSGLCSDVDTGTITTTE